MSPLIEAAKRGDAEIVRSWLDRGDDINQKTPEGGDTALIWAAFNGHAEVVRLLLERGANRDIVSHNGQTAIKLATSGGRQDIVRLLLQPPPPVRPAEAAESWAKMGAATVAQVGIYPEIQKKLTAIFNFESRERLIIAENMVTRAESITPPVSFDDLPRGLVEKALEAFTQLGGRADRGFVLDGGAQLIKPKRDLSPK